jgi:hypothetical protein
MSGDCRPTQESVDNFITMAKQQYGDDRWVSPQSLAWPSINDRAIRYAWRRTEGGDRKKWGLNNDLSWFSKCSGTAWRGSYLEGTVVRIAAVSRALSSRCWLVILPACCWPLIKA